MNFCLFLIFLILKLFFSFKKKKITIQEYITFNYSTNFILSLKTQSLNFSENKKIKKVEDKIKKIENENPYYNILNVLNDCFGKKDNENLKKYHNTISISTGIYVGLSYHYDKRCPINLLFSTIVEFINCFILFKAYLPIKISFLFL